MRRRLTVSLVALVAGSLLFAGAGSILITRSFARAAALRQLSQEAGALATAAHDVHTNLVLRTIARVLSLEDAEIIGVSSSGTVLTRLPAGMPARVLDTSQLLAGQKVSGQVGGLAFVAVPARLNPVEQARLPAGFHAVILLSRRIGNLGPSWLYFVLVAGVTFVVAAAVASQLSRRIARPLLAALDVTGQIAEGHLSGRVAIREDDFPEIRSLGESINSLAASLDAARTRERQLLLAVSHDLRTPLTSIRGFAEAIAEGAVEDPTRAAGVIISESRRLERLVADLLDLAKLETDRLSLTIGAVDASQVALDTMDAFRPQLPDGAPSLSAEVPPGGPTLVAADQDRLAQVVANLVENAIGFAHTRVSVSVRVGSGAGFGQGVGGNAGLGDGAAPGVGAGAAPGAPTNFGGDSGHAAGGSATGVVVLAVEDDGPGIAPADLGRVFDRFYQADRRGSGRSGSGLGLAIVAELIRAMGGAVRAESPVGPSGGTRMVVSLRPWRGPTPWSNPGDDATRS